MKIPKKIKVGGFIYDVERPSESFVNHTGMALDGEHSFSKKQIKVAVQGCDEYQQVVFLHEVCHAIIDCYLGSEKQDEGFVEQFAKGLYQVLKDNPEMLKEVKADAD